MRRTRARAIGSEDPERRLSEMSDVDTDPPVEQRAEVRVSTAVPEGPGGAGVVASSVDAQRLITTMIEAFTRTQAEVNRTFLDTLRSMQCQSPCDPTTSSSVPTGSTPVATATAAYGGGGNFARCTARFNGTSRDPEVLEAFVDAVQVYKECASVSDEHALRGLPMLLDGEAAVWWRGARMSVTTWADAVARLRAMYGAQEPAYKVLRRIFAEEQKEDERADVFVCKVRSLLVKVPYDIPEAMSVDIVYGLLHRRIRKRIPRDTIISIDLLLERARATEEALNEVKVTNVSNSKTILRSNVVRENQTNVTDVMSNLPAKRASAEQEQTGRCGGAERGVTISRNTRTRNKFESNSSNHSIRCYGCGQPGVVRSKCDKCAGSRAPAKSFDFNTVSIIDTSTTSPLISIEVVGKEGVAIIDTGATHSVVSPTLYSILVDAGIVFQRVERSIRLADGSRPVKTAMIATVPITLADRTIETELMAFPGNDTKTLLGRDFITNSGIILDIAQESWYFASNPTKKFSFVQSYVLNHSELLQTDVSDVCLREDEGASLAPEHRTNLNAFLENRITQFACAGPATDFAVHKIKVSQGQEPLASPPYRLSPPKREALEKELHELTNNDVIEECESPWASNVVLVKKKDGTFRLCIDYRKLNAVTEPDRYPLPRIEDVLHAAKTSKFMTSLDLRSGYFQVSVSEEDRDKTAFTTPLGTFRFKRMPMGLRNSGATFQRLIDRFKSNLPDVTLVAYLDDLLILSGESFDKHLADLEVVFDRLAMFNLRVNRDKSHFARDSVKFLGHVIVPGGIRMDPDKTSAITEMQSPGNVRHLKCFLQTTSWFRRFIPGYADIARPLTSLLKKASTWQWGPEQQAAFSKLKELLTSAPVLRQADDSKPFAIRTDSSGYAIGAALLQGEGPDERPIEYASRLLTASERNHSTTEREALAVVWAVTKFRGYIDGADVVVRSDHQPLRWLMSIKTPSGRLARWALILQEYNLKIEYTPGKSNVLADTLSRPPCVEGVNCDMCLTVVDMPQRGPREIREGQLLDPEVRKIVEALESDDPSRGRAWASKGYVISGGVLYRYGPENDGEDDASLVVPEQERVNVMFDYHDAPTAGHFGAERTLQRISGKYYWPGMRTYVTQYVKNCVTCQRYKVDNRKPAGLLQTPPVARRFEVIAVDLFGPLPTTTNGSKWILIVEDTCTRWVELYALASATSEECARTLVSEVFLRYGVPRRLVSDNGVQFIGEVMQQTCHVMGVTQTLTSYYHPEANPVERKNRDLKPQLAILVGKDHRSWDSHLPAIRFAMNSAVTAGTGYSPAYLCFARELRAPADVLCDMRSIVENDNFVTNITPYLKGLTTALADARDTNERTQAAQKRYADEHRRPAPDYQVGDLVLLKTQGSNDAGKGQTPKFIPRRDGPYRVQGVLSPTTYSLERVTDGVMLGKYHASLLTPFVGEIQVPVKEKRRRGRPRKSNPMSGSELSG